MDLSEAKGHLEVILQRKPGFVVDFDNYSISENDSVSFTSLIYGASHVT